MDACKSLKMWWPGTELNRRRQPFQGCALPPELPGHAVRNDTRSACDPTDYKQSNQILLELADPASARFGHRIVHFVRPFCCDCPFKTVWVHRLAATQYAISRWS